MRKIEKDDLIHYERFKLINQAFNKYQNTHGLMLKGLVLKATSEGKADRILSFMGINYKITVEAKEDA